MVATLDNKPGWRCDVCKQAPSSWWAASCPKGCGHRVLACGRCASQAQVEQELAGHEAKCSQDLGSPPPGFQPYVAPRRAVGLTTQAARVGAHLGSARGKSGAAMGGVLGAALGALTTHILNQPELQGLIGVAQNLSEPASAIVSVVRSLQLKPVAETPPAPPEEKTG
jgi:hypothetical protein